MNAVAPWGGGMGVCLLSHRVPWLPSTPPFGAALPGRTVGPSPACVRSALIHLLAPNTYTRYHTKQDKLDGGCKACPAGRIAPGVVSTECADCPSGKFSQEIASAACQDTCPESTYGLEGACLPCSPGKYLISKEGPASIACLDCLPGYHCPEASTTSQGSGPCGVFHVCSPGSARRLRGLGNCT